MTEDFCIFSFYQYELILQKDCREKSEKDGQNKRYTINFIGLQLEVSINSSKGLLFSSKREVTSVAEPRGSLERGEPTKILIITRIKYFGEREEENKIT